MARVPGNELPGYDHSVPTGHSAQASQTQPLG
jgi:hypothetical protein